MFKALTHPKTMATIGIVGLILTAIEEKRSKNRGDIKAAEEAKKLQESLIKVTSRSLSKVFWGDNTF
ncbi:hypothetical protein QYC27_10745 [Thermosynechococcus sp. PP45]|nr:hypothetical protein [Thermosynechococcus sp. PP45]WKT80759.1 hypothetical protein QYC27_10745 [Thermosynechococcus sp. PP45]